MSSGRSRLELDVTRADARERAQLALHHRRVLRPARRRPRRPARSTYFSALAPKPTFTRAPGSTASASRSWASMSCLVRPAALARAGSCSSGQRGAVCTSGSAAPGVKVSAPGAAAAHGGVDQLHVRVALHQHARLLGGGAASAA
jgi:hypothetical protein